MSVDDRLRLGLEVNATSFRPEAEARLAAVHRRHRRRRAVLAAVVAVAVVTGIGAGGVWIGRGDDQPTRGVQPVAPVTGPRIPDSAWERTVTRRQAVALGLGRDFLRQNFGAADEVPVVLSFFGEAYSQSGRYAGRWQVGDAGTVAYDGDVLVLTSTSPGCAGCAVRLDWRISDGVLRFSDRRDALEPDDRLMWLGRWSRQAV